MGAKDRISELPDDVIGIIISHLKLGEAERTSVLSRRWKYLWKLTSRFNFDGCEKIIRLLISVEEKEWKELMDRKRRNYISWVDQVVDNHEGSHLDELVVDFDLDATHSSYLDKWISFALSKRAKTIEIKLFPHFYNDDNERYSFIKSAPALSGIECLSSLRLNYVRVTGELIEQLFSVCPLLKRLSLADTENLRNLKVIGPSLKLKYFKIDYCSDLKSIEISAPNLVSFQLKKNWLSEILLQVQNLSSLVDLYIAHSDKYVFSQFSSCFSRLKTLTLSCPLNKGFLNLLGHSQFTSLKHLTFIDMSSERDCMQCLPEFISLCPVLRKFTLNLTNTKLEEMKWGERCLNSLKVVELINFFGHDHEIEISMFFLRNAIRLEKFIIEHLPWTSWGKEKQLQAVELVKTKVPQGVELLIKTI